MKRSYAFITKHFLLRLSSSNFIKDRDTNGCSTFWKWILTRKLVSAREEKNNTKVGCLIKSSLPCLSWCQRAMKERESRLCLHKDTSGRNQSQALSLPFSLSLSLSLSRSLSLSPSLCTVSFISPSFSLSTYSLSLWCSVEHHLSASIRASSH